MVEIAPAYLVGGGAMVGAVLRHLTYEAVDRETFPVGTLVVNVVGSFVLGFVTFSGAGPDALLLVGTGACGSYTTYSSFSFDVVDLWTRGERWPALGFALVNLVGALAALAGAWVVSGVVG